MHSFNTFLLIYKYLLSFRVLFHFLAPLSLFCNHVIACGDPSCALVVSDLSLYRAREYHYNHHK